MDIAGKTAIITGGAGSLGRALTSALLNEGARAIVYDRDAGALAALAEVNPVVNIFRVDLTDAEAVVRTTEQVFQDIGAVEILINNAGAIRGCPLVNILQKTDRMHPVALWRETLALNLDSVFNATRSVADLMLRSRIKGVIINISSVVATGNAGQSAYAAAKAGVNALTAVWARELGPLGIRCAAVSPGFIDTPSTHSALSETAIERLRKEIPLRRMGEAIHVAQAVLHAIQNDYIHGSSIPVDGGIVL